MLDVIAAVFAVASLGAHYASALCAAPLPRGRATPAGPVSLVIPLCGIEPFSRECLAAALDLDHPAGVEILFCVARADDPIAALAASVIQQRPGCRARILVGNDVISANPKLNNIAKGYRTARHPWVAFVDSNVLMSRDYLARLFDAWDEGTTGAVCAPAAGSRPDGFGAALECAFLNTYQARWQFAANAIGMGFAQGKCLFVRRDLLEQGGGIEALGAELAEDAALTKLVRRLGLQVRLADRASDQPLGRRRFGEVWRRQVRWARLRRKTFPAHYAPEILTSGLLPIAAAGLAGGVLSAFVVAVLWWGTEFAVAKENGWPAGLGMLPALIARDALLPVVWLAGWLGSGFEWRGNAMSVAQSGRAADDAPRRAHDGD